MGCADREDAAIRSLATDADCTILSLTIGWPRRRLTLDLLMIAGPYSSGFTKGNETRDRGGPDRCARGQR